MLEVSRAFGLGWLGRGFTVFKGFRLEWVDPAVIYVTGESGGGKTTLLKAFKRLYGSEAISMDEVEVDEDEVLCEAIGRDTKEALYYLSMAGLAEAYLFIRSYGELSAGQRYRYRLAKMFYKAVREGMKAVIVDEFCSLLDRTTARVVAYLTQKLSRRLGLTLVAASSHTDIAEDLNPDILVVKPFLQPPVVEHRDVTPKPFSLSNLVRIVEGRFRDYFKLERFHYKGFRPAYPAKVFKAVYGPETIGVIVYSHAPIACRCRRMVFGSNLWDYVKSGRLLAISRVVVHPKWRGVGLGVRLVRETLSRCGADVVETMAAMAVYNPFFEKAGMRLGCSYTVEYDEALRRLDRLLNRYGFDPKLRTSWRMVYDWLEKLDSEKLEEFKRNLSKLRLPRVNRKTIELRNRLKTGGPVSLHSLATYLFSYPSPGMKYNYYYWLNPRVERLLQPRRVAA